MMRFIIIFLALIMMHNSSLAQTAADEFYDPSEMAKARAAVKSGAGGRMNFLFLADRLEFQSGGEGLLNWDTQGWIGGDINRLWFKSEGEYAFDDNEFEDASMELLYGRAISSYFDLQLGLGQGLEKGPSPTYSIIGIQGLAPYWFEIDTNIMISFEAEYDLLFTQKFILQPRLEAGVSLQDIPLYDLGSGLTDVGLSLRLRYEITKQFSPYIGLTWSQKLGDTADIARLSGEGASNISILFGLRTWF
jgi:copper resistance protein B